MKCKKRRRKNRRTRRRFFGRCYSISSRGKLRNMFARGDISTTTTESIILFFFATHKYDVRELLLPPLPGLMLLHILYILNTKEENEDHFHSLCVAAAVVGCRHISYRCGGFERLLLSILELHIHTRHTLWTNCMQAYEVREYTILFASNFFFYFFLQLLLLDDGLNVCACNSIRWIDSTQKRKKSDDDDAGTKKIELNWNWSAHIIMCAYRRHRCTIVSERERSECVYFATHTKCIGGV